MCYRKANHVLYFRPFKDTHGDNRAWLCTVGEKDTYRFARGVSICSLDDTPDDKEGRQLAYNRAARILAGRTIDAIMNEKAWEAVAVLAPMELARFTSLGIGMYDLNGPIPFAYPEHYEELTHKELNFFTRKGFIINPKPEDTPSNEDCDCDDHVPSSQPLKEDSRTIDNFYCVELGDELVRRLVMDTQYSKHAVKTVIENLRIKMLEYESKKGCACNG
jgi:hypothetical protein